MLIALSGLPGTGKSTIACLLADRLSGVWLRIDSIEQAIRTSGVLRESVDEAGYLAAQAVAADNLRVGRTVVADCVNPWMQSRDAWRDIGLVSGACVVELEIICSDAEEHRQRVETRTSEVPGLALPDWKRTKSLDYHSWDRDHVVVDTAGRLAEDSLALILAAL